MNIGDLIRKIVKEDKLMPLVCKVISVDESENTIDVSPINDDAEIYDVRLVTTPGVSGTVVSYPIVGSLVLVQLFNDTTAYVTLTEDVDKIVVTVGDRKVELDGSGLEYSNNVTDLKSSIDDLLSLNGELISIIQTLQLNGPTGPAVGATGTSIAKLTAANLDLKRIESQFNQLLK